MKKFFLSKNCELLIILLGIYVSFVTYINGTVVIVPNVHTYVLLPIFLFSVVLLCSAFFSEGIRISRTAFLIIPYFVNVILRYLLSGIQDMAFLWFGCIVVLLLCKEEVWFKNLLGILLAVGYWECLGITVQILFPTFYNNHIGCLFSTYSLIQGWADSYGYAGFFFQVGFASLALLFAEIASVSRWFSAKTGRECIRYAVSAGIFIFFIILTGKRGTTLVSLLIVLLMSIIDRRTRKIGVLMLCAGAFGSFVLFILLVKLGPDGFKTHFLSRLAVSVSRLMTGEDFTSSRITLWKSAIDVFRMKPVFGTGIHSYWFYSGTGAEPHCTYLEILCEQGVVGFILFIIPVFWILIRTIGMYLRNAENNSGYIVFSILVQLEFIFDSMIENTLSANMIELALYVFAISIANINELNANPGKTIGLNGIGNNRFHHVDKH